MIQQTCYSRFRTLDHKKFSLPVVTQRFWKHRRDRCASAVSGLVPMDPHLQPLMWGPWQFFLSRNNFFQWDGLRVCLFDRPPFFYINKPVLGHCIEFPLLIIFHNKNKKPKDLNFIQMVVGAMDKSGTRIEIAGSQRSQRCPRISRVTPVRLDSLRSNV